MPDMKTVSDLGGPTVVARIVGVKVPSVHGWRSIPARHCPTIEKALDGEVTVEQMRPDVAWLRVKDKTWPHPKGRPCEDHASKQEA